VTADECEAITCSVDVLSPSQTCELGDLDPECYGVIVESGFRRGVLLPALDGIDSVKSQVRIALQKAGIRPEEPYDVRRFTVTRYRHGDAPRDDPEAPGDGADG
jgi:AMMECR1 domain-containing protein